MTLPSSSLLRLPLELKLFIYQYALSRGGEYLPSRKSLCLLQTCRQIYIEARLIPFSGITVSLESRDEFDDLAWFGVSAPPAVELLHRLLPWQRRAVSLEVLCIRPCFLFNNFATNWSTFCNLCNEAGLRLKALSVTTACLSHQHWENPSPKEFRFSRFCELLVHPDIRVTYRCTKSARLLPDPCLEMLENMRTYHKADTGRGNGGSIRINLMLGMPEDGQRPCEYLSARGVAAEYPAWRSRYVQLVPEFKVLPTDW